MADLTSMKNIGKEMARKLAAVGVASPEELTEAGARDAFFRLKTLYPNVCLVHLYALEGAVCQTELSALSKEKKRELKEYADTVKAR